MSATATSVVEALMGGIGAYSIAEAAVYARMHPSLIRRWFFQAQGRAPRFRAASIDVEGEKLLSFQDFVEAVYVRTLRVKHKIPFEVIRTAIGTAQNLEGIAQPFAHPNYRTVVIGKEIHIQKKDSPRHLIDISNVRGQTSSAVILDEYIEALEFDEENLVTKFIAHVAQSERVVMTPSWGFGEPFVESCGYKAETLWTAVRAEGSIEEVAEVYQVAESAVKAAVDYCESLLPAAAREGIPGSFGMNVWQNRSLTGWRNSTGDPACRTCARSITWMSTEREVGATRAGPHD